LISTPGKNVDIVLQEQSNRLPFDDSEFDLIICTQVLEHYPEPFEIVKEFYKVLKPNGKAIISVPFCWEFHPSPKDYWRFTEEGLLYLFKSFSKIEILSVSSIYNNNSISQFFHWRFIFFANIESQFAWFLFR
jgi:SAM-dependent methyltransferase